MQQRAVQPASAARRPPEALNVIHGLDERHVRRLARGGHQQRAYGDRPLLLVHALLALCQIGGRTQVLLEALLKAVFACIPHPADARHGPAALARAPYMVVIKNVSHGMPKAPNTASPGVSAFGAPCQQIEHTCMMRRSSSSLSSACQALSRSSSAYACATPAACTPCGTATPWLRGHGSEGCHPCASPFSRTGSQWS